MSLVAAGLPAMQAALTCHILSSAQALRMFLCPLCSLQRVCEAEDGGVQGGGD
jgi:hypothetical protein